MRKLSLFALGAVLTGSVLALAASALVAEPAGNVGPPAADTLETRTLKMIMVALGQDMSRVNDGIWYEDYAMIRQGAAAIAAHPRVTADEMKAIQGALGEQFEQFVRFDRLVHDAAEAMADAAAQRNMSRVLQDYATIQQGCVSCHAAFREPVRVTLYRQVQNSTPEK